MEDKIMIKRFCMSIMVFFIVITCFGQNSKSYTPPAEIGDIYIVVKYKLTMGTPVDTKITGKWGTWTNTATMKIPAAMGCAPEGVVIKLKHSKPDQVPLTIDSNGAIISILQSNTPPQQFGKCAYKTVEW
jgi:hypothetical protein